MERECAASVIIRAHNRQTSVEAGRPASAISSRKRGTHEMKAVIYARTATRKQTQHGNSMQAQIEACTKYAKENGYEVTDVFPDAGYSGTKLDRPGLNRLRDLISRESIDTVVVSDLARLTRSTTDKSRLEKEFTNRSVELRCVTSGAVSVTTKWFRTQGSRQLKCAHG